jgi:CspA family cold shock protein
MGDTNGNIANRERGRIAMIATDKVTSRRKGFGFIRPDVGSEQVFFHATDMRRGSGFFSQVVEGQRVDFATVSTPKGPRAVDVEVVV